MRRTRGISGLLWTGAGLLMLASCMPDSESGDRQAKRDHERAQVAHYGHAFRQYASRSLNAVVNSDLWKAQTLPEGHLDLTASGLGSHDLGGAEAYIASAYCEIAGMPNHLTWFEPADAEGRLFLKGIGHDRAGQTATYLRLLIGPESFGVARGGVIEMADGSQITPDGGCASLNIPHGSAVAVMPLSRPVETAVTQDKYIVRALSCPDGEEGNIMQRVMGAFMPDGAILIGTGSYGSEAAVMADDSLPWAIVSDHCLKPTEQIVRSMGENSVDALDMAALEGLSEGDIKAALAGSLTGINCKKILDESDPQEEQTEDERKLYDTCADPVTIEPVDPLAYNLTGTDEEELSAQCGGAPAGSGTVTVTTGLAMFNGIPDSLSGKPAGYAHSAWSGDVTYRKTTSFYEIIEGREGRAGGRSSDCAEEGCMTRTLVTYKGLNLQCEMSENLSVSCNAMYPGIGGNPVASDPLDFVRSWHVRGWADVENLVPNQSENTGWIEGAMNCVWRETRSETGTCPAGYFGYGTITQYERFFTATTPTNGSWGGWSVYSTSPATCEPPRRETRSETGTCPTGYSGHGTITHYERFFAATTPTEGAWSGWSVYNTSPATCEPPPPPVIETPVAETPEEPPIHYHPGAYPEFAPFEPPVQNSVVDVPYDPFDFGGGESGGQEFSDTDGDGFSDTPGNFTGGCCTSGLGMAVGDSGGGWGGWW